jgi:hypothetical protein
VIGGRSLVVAAIGEHLNGELAAQPPQRSAQQRVVAEENREPDERLQVLDEVVPPEVGLCVTAEESGVRGELPEHRPLGQAPADQERVDPAQRPGAQGGRVRVPGRAPPGADGRGPRIPQGWKRRPCRRALAARGKPPGPVPVIQVKAPEQRLGHHRPVGRRPVGGAGRACRGDHAADTKQAQLARQQRGRARPVPPHDRVERRERCRPSGRPGRARLVGTGEQQLAGKRHPVLQSRPLRAQSGPRGYLAGP